MARILVAGRQVTIIGLKSIPLSQFFRKRGPNNTLACPTVGKEYRTENLSYLTLVDARKSYSSLREVIPMREEPLVKRQEVLHQEILIIPEVELMKGLERLGVIRKLSRKNPDWKHKDLFRLLHKEDIWIAAYKNIKGLTSGVTKETLDGLGRKVQMKVLEEGYQFKPVRLKWIPKANGPKRPLGIPTRDKLVQEVIRMVVAAIYEPNFDNRSFGFRSGMGVHDSLEYVEKQFRWVDWVIQGDINSAYPTIEDKKLCEILSHRIDDGRFMNLIRKSLKCGVWNNPQTLYSKLGIPQGSIVSPIIANIYYNQLDRWVTQKSKDQVLIQNNLILKGLIQQRNHDQGIEIRYTRYADDWIIGIQGPRKLAELIKDEVGCFFRNHLNQELDPNKTKVIDLRAGIVYFLGYDIFLPRNMKLVKYKGKGKQTMPMSTPMLRFQLPVDKVTKRLQERGYITYVDKKLRPTSKSSSTPLEDAAIVNHFKSVWLELFNFYSGCTNRSHLQYIHYLLHMSCAMTLAHRHRSSSSKIFKKHGKRLEIMEKKGNTQKVIAFFPYHTNWKISDRKWQTAKTFQNPFTTAYPRLT